MNDARKNSVEQLAELYTVIIGIALTIAVGNSIDTSVKPLPLKLSNITNMITLLAVLIPFYHGATRHLFATYVEGGGSRRIRDGALLADFVLLFLEGLILIMLSYLLGSTGQFAWAIVSLLLLDSVWGLLANLAFTGAQAQRTERKWAIINIVASAALGGLLYLLPEMFWSNAICGQIVLLVGVVARTTVDYSLCWAFYFPPSS